MLKRPRNQETKKPRSQETKEPGKKPRAISRKKTINKQPTTIYGCFSAYAQEAKKPSKNRRNQETGQETKTPRNHKREKNQ